MESDWSLEGPCQGPQTSALIDLKSLLLPWLGILLLHQGFRGGEILGGGQPPWAKQMPSVLALKTPLLWGSPKTPLLWVTKDGYLWDSLWFLSPVLSHGLRSQGPRLWHKETNQMIKELLNTNIWEQIMWHCPDPHKTFQVRLAYCSEQQRDLDIPVLDQTSLYPTVTAKHLKIFWLLAGS